MDKLKEYSLTRLKKEYLKLFDYEPTADRDTILAALYYGKRAESLTEEEKSTIYEF